jgi:DnaJ domain
LFGGLGGGAPSTGQASTVDTDTIRMTLDHDTGEMDGEVVKGRFDGRRLSSLGFPDLLLLLDECRAGDPNGAQLLEAYLDRMHREAWRAHQDGEGNAGADSRKSAPRGEMSLEEATATLGLQPGATRDEIKQAHRRLMKKLHPDQGGSTYLASKINQAKDVLLKAL